MLLSKPFGNPSVDRPRAALLYARNPLPLSPRRAMTQHRQPQPYEAARSGPLNGAVRVPGDKSISQCALMLGALATGQTNIAGMLESTGVLGTIEILDRLGVPIVRTGEDRWRVFGRGVGGLTEPNGDLDLGNSSTRLGMMFGALTGHGFPARIADTASPGNPSMEYLLKPLQQMGLQVAASDRDTLPLTVKGRSQPIPITHTLEVPSAQAKSAILLAGLAAPGQTTVVEPVATPDHTERMLRQFGAEISVVETAAGRATTVKGNAELKGRDVFVPADPSLAAFVIAAGAIVPGSDVTVLGVLFNPARTSFYQTLKEMGADLAPLNERTEGGEPIADIRVRASHLHAVRVPPSRATSMIDDFPILAVVAATADGTSRLEGLSERRSEISDKLAATAAGLVANGIVARVEGNVLEVEGRTGIAGGGRFTTGLDHRLAMAFLVLGQVSHKPVVLDDISAIAANFPLFIDVMTELGAVMRPAGHKA